MGVGRGVIDFVCGLTPKENASAKDKPFELMGDFPQMPKSEWRDLRKCGDEAFKDFARTWGDAFETALEPVKQFLIWFEWLLLATPWPIVLVLLSLLVFLTSRRIALTIGAFAGLFFIGYFTYWEDAMKTLAMILTATVTSILLGIPIGVLMSRFNRAQSIFNPILDFMQTVPSFVYLIPVIMLFGIGKIPGIVAVIIYAIPPVIRLTNLGIREVNKEVLEAADAFGSSAWKKLTNVQIPLALPTIMAGVNQTIMMALAMVVVAAMVGAPGLGQPILQAINNQFLTMGVFAGAAIAVIAIIIDRATQAYGKRLQDHRQKGH